MKAIRNEIDSLTLGRSALDLRDLTEDSDIAAMERQYLAEHDPAYVLCKVPIEQIGVIHRLEELGFRFVEFQLRMSYRPAKKFDTSAYPYRFERVTSEESLKPVLEIASTTFEDDRFLVDPWIAPGLSGERYRRYVAQSFAAEAERVYRLVKPSTGETLAFKTHRMLGSDEVLHLLGGVKSEYKRTGLAVICEYFELNELIDLGIKKTHTHISGRNYAVMNLELRGLGFRAEKAFAVLRKCYGECPAPPMPRFER
jgi:hypothetical protein